METTHIELTPEQKALLASMSEETGKSPMELVEEALKGLRNQAPPDCVNNGGASEGDAQQTGGHTKQPGKPIWEIADELFDEIPEEELERQPIDGATQHDHYLYGTPKRPE
jgi:hypothetical protein